MICRLPQYGSKGIGRASRGAPGAFTLLEIMVVIGVLAMILAMGIPAIVRIVEKAPLQRSVDHVMEALNQARAQAILQGVPEKFVLRGDGSIGVPGALGAAAAGQEGAVSAQGPPRPAPVAAAPGGDYHAGIDPDVAVRFIGVNLVEQMDAEEVEVMFYPNGTSDDFTLVLEDSTGVRAILLDPVTGFAEVKFIR